MLEIIEFLDDHSGSLTFLVTFVYVVATIFICWANIKSANASKKQLEEMQRQYAESNRPNIEVEVVFLKRSAYGLRFINHGNQTANNVKIELNSEFIDALPEKQLASMLHKQKDKRCIIGVGQHYDLYFGSNALRENPPSIPAKGTIYYQDNGQEYESDFEIDVVNYGTFFSVDNEHDDLMKQLKELNGNLSKMVTTMKSISNSLKEEEDA